MANTPRKIEERELRLMALYSQCQLGMSPQKFYGKWDVTYEQMAEICCRSISTVKGWFKKGRHYQRPTPADLRNLAVMDFFLEHFEKIGDRLWKLIGHAEQ